MTKRVAIFITLLIGIFYGETQSVWVQKVYAQAAPAASACDDPKTKRARQKCFLERYRQKMENLEKRKERNALYQEKLEYIETQKKQKNRSKRQRTRQQQQSIEKSRKRNKSNAGKPYNVTFGRYVETRE